MKGIMFKPDILEAKLKVLEQYGEAQTRRQIKSNRKPWGNFELGNPRYRKGETIYIKEPYTIIGANANTDKVTILYSDNTTSQKPIPESVVMDLIPHTKMFMPAWAARRFLFIKDVWAEKLELPLSPQAMILEGGKPALEMLGKINGLWVWVYTIQKSNGE